METEKQHVLVTSPQEAKRFMMDCFEAVGTCRSHSEIIAENLLLADYRGHFSHGMNRLDMYIDDLQNNIVQPNAVPVVENETPATALVKGNNTLGPVIGKFCMDLCIKKAKEVGIGMVTSYESNHYGIAGIYSLQAMKEGLIGISTTNASLSLVPTRAKDAAMGSNPISFGLPGKNDDHFLLDMATTTVAMGKVEICKRKGAPIPEGWALDEEGHPTTDSSVAFNAHRVMPIGGSELTSGYKGYGLALMVEVLSSVLSGANLGPQVPRWIGTRNEISNLGQCFIAINPEVFAPGYQDRLADLMNHIRNMTPVDPDKPVLIPGDPENEHMRRVDKQGGFCYIENQHKTNDELAKILKVKPMFSELKVRL